MFISGCKWCIVTANEIRVCGLGLVLWLGLVVVAVYRPVGLRPMSHLRFLSRDFIA